MTSDEGSVHRRDSGSSSSSEVAEGTPSRTPHPRPRNGDSRLAGHLTLDSSVTTTREVNSPGTFSTLAARRSSGQSHRDRAMESARSQRPSTDSDVAALETAFASATPNFLSVAPGLSSSSNARRSRDRARAGERSMPGSFSSPSPTIDHRTVFLSGDERYTNLAERPLPPLPTSGSSRASVPIYNGASAADYARHRDRAARSHPQPQLQFIDPFVSPSPTRQRQEPASHNNQDRQGQQYSNGPRGPTGHRSSGSNGTNTAHSRPNEGAAELSRLRINETDPASGSGHGSGNGNGNGNGSGSGGSPLRWISGFVGWPSDRDRE